MIDEYNMADDGVGFINGDMNLSDESPIEAEISEGKNITKMNESQFRNLVYEITLKMLDEQLNEDDPAAAGAAPPMDPAAAGGAAGAPMDPMAAGGAPMPQATDADAEGLPGKYLKIANDYKTKKAQEVGDNSGGAPGFAPKGDDDDKKKEVAKQVAESVLRQLKKEFSKKK